jgi:hypothetical protein
MNAELFEFASKLKKQGTTLSISLGQSLGIALKQAGFRPDQEITVRFGNERLEILPRDTPEQIRDKVKLEAVGLRAFRERILDLAKRLPAASEEDLEAGESLEGELLGMLECLVADDLDPAIHKLETVDDLGPEAGSGSGAPPKRRF